MSFELTPPPGPEAQRGPGRPAKYCNADERREARRRTSRQCRARRRAEQEDREAAITQALEGGAALADVVDEEVQEPHDAALVEQRDSEFDEDLREHAQRWPLTMRGFQYARDVIAGRINVCGWVRKACERHERDLARQDTPDWPYAFDPERSEHYLNCAQMWREVKGPRAGHRLVLQPWQLFVFASAFGWIDAATEVRRFRYVLLFVPRGNGKTTCAAPFGIYMLALDGEGGAEVFAAAVTRDQAKLVFKTAQTMVNRDSAFRHMKGVEVAAHAIVQPSSASEFRPLSRDAQALDGLNVHGAILDELAAHKQREVHDVIVTATGKRLQPMILAITTAGNNQSSVGFEQWKWAQRVLDQEETDETFLCVLYTIDEGDDWTDVEVMRKANPNWGVSVMPDTIINLCRRAQANSAQQAAFKQKHLNLWTNAAVQWMNSTAWDACGDKSLAPEQLAGAECVIGMDLAAKVDLAAIVLLFRRMIDGRWHYYAFPIFYLPMDVIRSQRHPKYAGWYEDGLLRASIEETATTDYLMVQQDISEAHERYGVRDVAYDPWQAKMLAANLERSGIPVIEVRPTVSNFSPAMKELDALVRERRFHHPANEILSWNVDCVEAWTDLKDNVFPRKDKTDALAKIDGAVALLMALARYLALDVEPVTDIDAMIV